ncbi:MAG: quinolinate synthase NadA [Gammaproteobacteria bacterium]|nr:MAG: quinolinate synthase NadA [Gammaproteobacteria bacterium]
METSAKNLVPKSLLEQHKHRLSLQDKTNDRENELINRIKEIVKQEDIALISHYYTDDKIQKITEDLGGCVSDSLQMAKYGKECNSNSLVVSGVKFMGETAKILSPNKRVYMPTLEATCSLDLGCPAEEFKQFCDKYPDREIVVYANTSADVKAIADWVVTSSIALEVIDFLDAEGKKIVWGPDKHLGGYIQKETKADMILWDGACVVHEEFKHEGLLNLKKIHNDADVLVHPESPSSVVDLADCVGSTSQIIDYANNSVAKKFIVATDKGIFYQLIKNNPDKEFFEAPTAGNGATCNSCSRCPWMGMNSLENLYDAISNKRNEIHVAKETIRKAQISLNRMVNFK